MVSNHTSSLSVSKKARNQRPEHSPAGPRTPRGEYAHLRRYMLIPALTNGSPNGSAVVVCQ